MWLLFFYWSQFNTLGLLTPAPLAHPCVHTQKSKSKSKASHVFLDKPGHLCIKQVRCAVCYEHSWSPGSSQEVSTMPPTAGVGTLCPTTTISGTMRHSRCALLPQYKTRYPFYRWVGWSTGDFLLFFLPPALPVSSGS